MTRDQRWLVVRRFHEIARVLSPEDGTVVEVKGEERERVVSDIREQIGRA